MCSISGEQFYSRLRVLPDLALSQVVEEVAARVEAAGEELSDVALGLRAAALSDERRQCVNVPHSTLQDLQQRGVRLVPH